jgi:hypothetical protein
MFRKGAVLFLTGAERASALMRKQLWMSRMDGRSGATWSACVVPKTTTVTYENDQRGLIGRVRGKTPKGVAGDLCPRFVI